MSNSDNQGAEQIIFDDIDDFAPQAEETVPETEETQEATATEEEVIVDEAGTEEELASDVPPGHIPYDEWVAKGNDPDQWKSPKVFKEVGDLHDSLSHLRRRQDEQQAEFRRSLDEMRRIQEKQIEAKVSEERARTIKELQTAKREAMEIMDYDKVDMIDEQILDARMETFKQPKVEEEPNQQSVQDTPDPQFVKYVQNTRESFMEQNPWVNRESADYNQDLADMVDVRVKRLWDSGKYTDYEYDKLLNDAANGVKEQYLKPQKQTRAAPVAGAKTNSRVSSNVQSRSKFTPADMNEQQKQFAKTFVDTGAFPNEQAYVDMLVEIGEIS